MSACGSAWASRSSERPGGRRASVESFHRNRGYTSGAGCTITGVMSSRAFATEAALPPWPAFPQAARKAVKMWKKEKLANCGHCLFSELAFAPCASLECRLRRARSASRSKPNLRAVREGRKAKAKGQQERWTKAKPARRNSWSDAEGVRPRSGPVEGAWGNRELSPAELGKPESRLPGGSPAEFAKRESRLLCPLAGTTAP